MQSAENIDSTHRQVLQVTRESKELGTLNSAFVVKTLPSNRIMCLIGKKGTRFVEMIEFITNDLILLKFYGDGNWAMLDTMGHVQEIPQELMKILNRANFDQI